MNLQLDSCLLRSWHEEDAASLQRYANNRNIWLNLRDIFPHPYRLEDAQSFLKFASQQNPEVMFAIATSGEAIGGVGLRFREDVHRKTAEVGYWLAEPFWGRGIMSEVVTRFTRYAFDSFDLVRICAEPLAHNRASARVLEKAGFVCEGCMKANVLKDGIILDSLLYARIREEPAK